LLQGYDKKIHKTLHNKKFKMSNKKQKTFKREITFVVAIFKDCCFLFAIIVSGMLTRPKYGENENENN